MNFCEMNKGLFSHVRDAGKAHRCRKSPGPCPGPAGLIFETICYVGKSSRVRTCGRAKLERRRAPTRIAGVQERAWSQHLLIDVLGVRYMAVRSVSNAMETCVDDRGAGFLMPGESSVDSRLSRQTSCYQTAVQLKSVCQRTKRCHDRGLGEAF